MEKTSSDSKTFFTVEISSLIAPIKKLLIEIDLSESFSMTLLENIKFYNYDDLSNKFSILKLYDESDNLLTSLDNSEQYINSTIFQYAGPSFNYNTSSHATDVFFPYSGDEVVFSYNLNYPTTGNYEWLVIKFDANGVAYGVNSQVQLYKNILTTPSSVIYDWTSTDYYHYFTVDNN